MKDIYLPILGLVLLTSSCDSLNYSQDDTNVNETDSLKHVIASLQNENDSLRQQLQTAIAHNNQIYHEREAALEEIERLKSKSSSKSSSISNPLAHYNLEFTRSKTGYVVSFLDHLFLPAINLEFRNKSNSDLTKSILLKYIFINNDTGEQIYEGTSRYCDSYAPLAAGLTKQVTKRSELGWYIVKDQKVSVRVYFGDFFWKEFKIETTTYQGRL